MKRALFALVFLWAACAAASDSVPLRLVNSVDLPKYSGDFDHFAADIGGNRLFLAAEDHGTLEVFDLKSTKWLRTIRGFEVPHSILYLPASQRLFVTDGGGGMSKVLNGRDLQILQKVSLVPGADSLVYDAEKHQAYVVTGGKDVKMKESVLSVIDTTDFRDSTITNQHITAHDGILFVHRHDSAAFDENRLAHESTGADYAGICEVL